VAADDDRRPHKDAVHSDLREGGVPTYHRATSRNRLDPVVYQINQLLERHGIRPTQQRVRVARILLAAPVHMTADQLLATLKQSPNRISKATVYNTLKLFVECGLARQIHLDPDRCVYDSTMTPHHHFQNVETGEMLDIQPEDLAFARLPPLPEGTEIDSVDVVIRVRRRKD
jgi:Fur family iron response transcriptional regulator